jgi:hypothetical protein
VPPIGPAFRWFYCFGNTEVSVLSLGAVAVGVGLTLFGDLARPMCNNIFCVQLVSATGLHHS